MIFLSVPVLHSSPHPTNCFLSSSPSSLQHSPKGGSTYSADSHIRALPNDQCTGIGCGQREQDSTQSTPQEIRDRASRYTTSASLVLDLGDSGAVRSLPGVGVTAMSSFSDRRYSPSGLCGRTRVGVVISMDRCCEQHMEVREAQYTQERKALDSRQDKKKI